MYNTKCPRRHFIRIALVTVILVILTRTITLTHNRQLHPDEHVFYHSVTSLVTSILEPGTPFVENKEYPEGTYYFQLPFQLAGQILRNLAGIDGLKGAQHLGRLASVFYFIISILLGLRLLWRYLGKGIISLWIYGLTMSFSLFFIEQSRYGTGDIISLMLVMLLINLTAQATQPASKEGWWISAFFVCGILGAVKYPQLVFTLIPLSAYLIQPNVHKKISRLLLFLLAVVAGFFLFSPKAMLDPGYILRVIQRESTAYSVSSVAGIRTANYLLNICLYLLLYSDFPLLPLVVLGQFLWRFVSLLSQRKTAAAKSATEILFVYSIPGVCLFFLTYNLFVSTQFFRTYTPLFGVLILYTSCVAEILFSRHRLGRITVLFLAVCMILRGIAFVWVLSDDDKIQKKLSSMVSGAVDENWDETWYTSIFSFPVSDNPDASVHDHLSMDPLIEYNDGYTIQPGQLVITGAWAFYRGYPYLLGKDAPNVVNWTAFTAANQNYYVGRLYPDFYYYLFGGWVRGSTLSQYEFPCHFIYYRSQ